MNRNALLTPHLCLCLQKGFPAGCWSFFGIGSEKKWYYANNERPRGEWERGAELMMVKFRESQHPVFRAMSVFCPEERSKAEEVENVQDTSVPMGIRLKIFAQLFLLICSVFTEQSQMCVRNTVLLKEERGDPGTI